MFSFVFVLLSDRSHLLNTLIRCLKSQKSLESAHGSVFQESGVSDSVTRSPKELILTTELKSFVFQDNSTTVQYGGLVSHLANKAKSIVSLVVNVIISHSVF